jgi:hypothetical protein
MKKRHICMTNYLTTGRKCTLLRRSWPNTTSSNSANHFRVPICFTHTGSSDSSVCATWCPSGTCEGQSPRDHFQIVGHIQKQVNSSTKSTSRSFEKTQHHIFPTRRSHDVVVFFVVEMTHYLHFEGLIFHVMP